MYIGNKLPFRIDSTLVGFIFFSFGYYCKKALMEIKEMTKIKLLFIAILSLIVLVAVCHMTLDFGQRQGLSINAVAFGRYPLLFLFSGVSGTLLVLSLSQLLKFVWCKPIKIISNGTIIILGFHHLVIMIFRGVITTFNPIFAIAFSAMVLAVCYGLIILSSKYCPTLLGNRKIN